ncbi:hypothetical protein MG293_020557 [Ovis ammon polii]|uniref:COP9 signalosome complex subunit 9 n=1 Tax=Ovis ammon polii TaxID=230172 RepID=A0AAD4TN92_OVIAM|nr:hypothetical protein MG293_020557 [Ovis ammon polii]
MKPAVDEMFPEGTRPYVDLDEAGGSTGLLMDLAANEKAVHADFFNDFEDLFDDDDIQYALPLYCPLIKTNHPLVVEPSSLPCAVHNPDKALCHQAAQADLGM